MSQVNTGGLAELGTLDGNASPQTTAAPTQRVETAEEKANRLEQQFGLLQQQVQLQNQQQVPAQQYLMDPDVQQVLLRKQQGRPVNFADDKPEAEAPIDYAQLMADPVQFAAALEKQMDKKVAAQVKALSAPIVRQQQAIQQNFDQQVTEKIQRQIADCNERYPDFKSHTVAMLELDKRVRGSLSPEELYKLVRASSGRPAPADERRQTASERPSSAVTMPANRAESAGPLASSLRLTPQTAFAAALDAGVDAAGLKLKGSA